MDSLTSELIGSYAGSTYSYLLTSVGNSFNDQLSSQLVVGSLFLVLWILILFFGFIYVWFKYISDLSKNIWRIQGMLSMIPTEIVCNNPAMKALFIQGGLSKVK